MWSYHVPAWRSFPVVEELMVRYQASVCVRTRIQMMTLGEFHSGSGAGIKDLLVIDMGREIKAGIISNGFVHLGAQGAAGLIGHFSTGQESVTRCACGNTGCLNVLAGSETIAADGTRAAREGASNYLAEVLMENGKVAPTDVLLAAEQGDSFSAELLSRCGRLTGAAIAQLVNALNPSAVVLTGTIAQSGNTLLASVRETVYRNAHPLVTRDLRITRSQMGSSASLAGAALVAVDNIFEPSFLSGWVAKGTPLEHHDLKSALLDANRISKSADLRPTPPRDYLEPAMANQG